MHYLYCGKTGAEDTVSVSPDCDWKPRVNTTRSHTHTYSYSFTAGWNREGTEGATVPLGMIPASNPKCVMHGVTIATD